MERVRRSDLFFVHTRTMASTADLQALALLYQPLVGVTAFSLYLTLFALMNKSTLVSEKYLHSDLESILDVQLESLEAARFKLEAAGLLTTAFKSDCFLYELILPMSASSFVNDGVLGQYLKAAVTEERYAKIIKLFKTAKVTRDGYDEGVRRSLSGPAFRRRRIGGRSGRPGAIEIDPGPSFHL